MLTDVQIAQSSSKKSILEIAQNLGILPEELELFGNYKAKISPALMKRINNNNDGKLILVTATSPTHAGEGKTTTTVGLGQAMNKLGKKAIVALREPSLGPVMGIKGGAAGGGYSQVVPMEDINLHFTGDMQSITAANNFLAAAIDNHIQHGNKLGIDPRQISWKRAMDMNDRSLRNIVVGLGGKTDGIPREDGFNITAASEVMSVLCLASGILDLKARLAATVIGFSYEGEPITVKDLKIQGAMSLLLKDAIKPNLIQTLENTPALMHGGPFANIAHGCNSVIATKLALKLADYVITEAGFGADLGAEKFFDIKCRLSNMKPAAAVLVSTIKALKYNGGIKSDDLKTENLDALKRGFPNLEKHVENLKMFGVPIIVAINHFEYDSPKEMKYIEDACAKLGVEVSFSDVYKKGGEGGLDLADKLVKLIESAPNNFQLLYDEKLPVKEKIDIVAKKIYGAKLVNYTNTAERDILRIQKMGFDNLPVCIAKTQFSFTDNPLILGRPDDFEITVREIRVAAGAGFIVVITGEMMTMPGLPKVLAAENIDIDENGIITGLF